MQGMCRSCFVWKKDCADTQVILNDRADLKVGDEVEIEEKEIDKELQEKK